MEQEKQVQFLEEVARMSITPPSLEEFSRHMFDGADPDYLMGKYSTFRSDLGQFVKFLDDTQMAALVDWISYRVWARENGVRPHPVVLSPAEVQAIDLGKEVGANAPGPQIWVVLKEDGVGEVLASFQAEVNIVDFLVWEDEDFEEAERLQEEMNRLKENGTIF